MKSNTSCIVCKTNLYRKPNQIKKRKYFCCSRKCNFVFMKSGIMKFKIPKGKSIDCKICGKTFYRRPCELKSTNENFCSYSCKWKCYRKSGKLPSPPRKRILLNCQNCNKSFETLQCEYKRNDKHFCNKKCSYNYNRGVNHKNYNPDRSKLIQKDTRHIPCPELKNWRTHIFIRDNRSCQICGSKKQIEAHHIKTWAKFPELRFAENNGITLCHGCHIKTLRKEEKFEDYFSNILLWQGKHATV